MRKTSEKAKGVIGDRVTDTLRFIELLNNNLVNKVSKTPEMLHVLARTGVIDEGGQGVSTALFLSSGDRLMAGRMKRGPVFRERI